MKLAVKHANTHSPDDLTISFFFNARGEPMERSIEGMYRSLLHQLMTEYPEFGRVLKLQAWEERGWPVELLQEHFRDCVLDLGKRTLTCYIDAIDECEHSDMRAMVQSFEDLGNLAVSAGIRLRTCFASRHYPCISMGKVVNLVLDSHQSHQEDIKIYVQDRLGIFEPAHRADLAKRITARAHGAFLWVVLVVQILTDANDRGEINLLQSCLRDVPAGIEKLYDAICGAYSGGDQRYLLPTLSLILCAWRPLTPLELYCGVLHTGRDIDSATGDGRPSPARLQRFITNATQGLAEVTVPSRGSESGKPLVQFIHESVREYLLTSGISKLDISSRDNSLGSHHEKLKAWCLEYVTFAGRKNRLSQQLLTAESDVSIASRKQLLDEFPFLSYAVQGLIVHAEAAQNCGITQASFVETFPLSLVIELSNLVLDRDKQDVPYPPSTSAAELFASLDASGLLQLVRAREEHVSRQGERPERTDSLPDLTMGSSDRYDSESIYDDTDSIRTDNEDNNLGSEEKSSYTEVFVSELKAGLYEVLHSKSSDHYARSCMSAALPDLLKSYALLLGHRARPGIEKEMITFIRHRRT